MRTRGRVQKQQHSNNMLMKHIKSGYLMLRTMSEEEKEEDRRKRKWDDNIQ